MEPRIIGGYTLRSLLGRGATSEVYAATHPVHGDHLAFKLLGQPLGDAAAIRAVAHPNVVRMIETGGDFVVMERIDGEDLATRLGRLGRLDEATARSLFAAIADGMQAVHDHGFVHRDLKPANVMLDGDVPKIVDFGIAKYLGERSAVATGRRIGSPAYMAPEQLADGLVAPCVDVWALGVMLFEAVTGRLPFDGFSDGRCPQLVETAPRATNVSPALVRLIARCLDRDPGRRPATMTAIAGELRAVADRELERVTQDVEPPRSAAPPVRSRRWLPFAIGGGAIAAIVGVAIAATSRGSAPEVAPLAPQPLASAPIAPPVASPPPPPQTPPATLAVDVRSAPPGADIVIDGRSHGTTPTHLELAGPTAIVVRRAGYRPAHVRAEHAGALDVHLVPLPRSQTHERHHTETLD